MRSGKILGRWLPLLLAASLVIPAVPAAIPPVHAAEAEAYVPPENPRVVYNFNMDWKFFKGDVTGAEAVSFDDSAWETVSAPHTYNDVDSFDEYITHDGEGSLYRGIGWYRKHFRLPAEQAGQKVFLEFEGIRQAAYVYVNGQNVGQYEAGTTPFGFDISAYVKFGEEDNVIAVKNDNRVITESSSGVSFQWQGRGFNPVYGGLTRNMNLYVMDGAYFTLPLYSNLKTYGTYIYPSEISTDRRTAVINVESQVKNDSDRTRTMSLEAVVVDREGRAVHSAASDPFAIASGEDYTFKAAGEMADVHFWQPEYPYLYQVYCILKEDGRAIDVYPITTGFRKAEFKGGYNTGGVYINNKQMYLTGYAQRSTNEWAVLGNAVPEWITDFDGNLIRESNANFIRWMHISAEPADIRMTDKYGIVSLQPAGDSEKDVTGRQWEQRVETMRDSIIYFRNSPSILFWEAGNNTITAEHMKEMRELKDRLDPKGMRAVGSRGLRDPAAVDHAEFVGTMLNRHYTDYARDRVPIIESEYTRDEAPRRVWDDFSPPDFGYKHDPSSTWTYNSEEFAIISGAANFYEYYKDRVQGPETSNDMYSAAAALIWADSNQHGRNYLTENSRMSGRVDAVRIPKESFYAYQVMQNTEPDLHIVGHWTYPAGTQKDIYVIANHVKQVELFVNGVSKGIVTEPTQVEDKKRNAVYPSEFVYTFPGTTWESGAIKAVGYDESGSVVAEMTKESAGAAAAIKLTPTTGPEGLLANGEDAAIFDVEVVDSEGRRLPTDQARIDFELTGPAKFLGGWNSGREHSTFKSYIDTEAGINRVFIRSTREAGEITLTAKREGLTPAAVTLASRPMEVTHGLTTKRVQALKPELPVGPPVYGPDVQPPPVIKSRVLSSRKPVTASTYGGGDVPERANDESLATRWSAGTPGTGQWLKVDLGKSHELTASEVRWGSSAYNQYKIEVSDDEVNWTLAVDRTQNTVRQQLMRDNFTAAGRYVRITITGMEATHASIIEFKVMGIGGSSQLPDSHTSFDFGSGSSPVETGYTQVTPLTEYSADRGYGFQSTAGLQADDRDNAPNALLRDSVRGQAYTFNVDLKSGDYDVTLTAGDMLEGNRTGIAVEGAEQQPLESESGTFDKKTYKVHVTDGQLNISFTGGRVNGLDIMPLPSAPAGLAADAVSETSVSLSWTPVSGAMKYSVYGAVYGSAEHQLLGSTVSPSFTDTVLPQTAAGAQLSYHVTTVMEMGEVTLIGESFPSERLLVPTDRTPPATQAAVEGTQGTNGWYTADVWVTLTAADSASGVKGTEYSLDQGTTWQSYNSPVPVPAEGLIVLQYRSIDNAGNWEEVKSLSLQIDRTAPVVTYTGGKAVYYVDEDVSIACQAVDTGSGIASSTCKDIRVPAYQLDLGPHRNTAAAADRAGLTGTGEVTFKVAVTYESLIRLIKRLISEGVFDQINGTQLEKAEQSRSMSGKDNGSGQLNQLKSLQPGLNGKGKASEEADLIRSYIEALQKQ